MKILTLQNAPKILNHFGVDLSQSQQEENVKIKWQNQYKRRGAAAPTCGFPSLAHGTKQILLEQNTNSSGK